MVPKVWDSHPLQGTIVALFLCQSCRILGYKAKLAIVGWVEKDLHFSSVPLELLPHFTGTTTLLLLPPFRSHLALTIQVRGRWHSSQILLMTQRQRDKGEYLLERVSVIDTDPISPA